MLRRNRLTQPDRDEEVNGWVIRKSAAANGERYSWFAIALDGMGYLAARHGFHTKSDAMAFASSTDAPFKKRYELSKLQRDISASIDRLKETK